MSELDARRPPAGTGPGRYDEVFVARMFHGATALVAVLGLVLQIIAMLDSPALGANPGHAWWNFLGYFSVQAAVLVFIVSMSLFMESARSGGTLWRSVRVVTLVAALLVFLLQFTDFRGLPEFAALDSNAVAADRLLNYAVPIMVVTGWLIFGPRPRISVGAALLSLIYPVLWIAGTLIRGAFTGWYPYTVLDVTGAGFATVLFNGIFLLLMWLGAAFLYAVLDSSMGREPDGYLPGFGPEDEAVGDGESRPSL